MTAGGAARQARLLVPPPCSLSTVSTRSMSPSQARCPRRSRGRRHSKGGGDSGGNGLSSAEKVALWEELKVAAFTRAVGALWLLPLLDLFVRVQLNILGRHLYLESALDTRWVCALRCAALGMLLGRCAAAVLCCAGWMDGADWQVGRRRLVAGVTGGAAGAGPQGEVGGERHRQPHAGRSSGSSNSPSSCFPWGTGRLPAVPLASVLPSPFMGANTRSLGPKRL